MLQHRVKMTDIALDRVLVEDIAIIVALEHQRIVHFREIEDDIESRKTNGLRQPAHVESAHRRRVTRLVQIE